MHKIQDLLYIVFTKILCMSYFAQVFCSAALTLVVVRCGCSSSEAGLYIFPSVEAVNHTDVQQLISVSLVCECAGTESPVTRVILQLIVVSSWGVSGLLLVTRVSKTWAISAMGLSGVEIEPLLRHQLLPDPLIWAAYQSHEKCAPH